MAHNVHNDTSFSNMLFCSVELVSGILKDKRSFFVIVSNLERLVVQFHSDLALLL